MIQIKDISFTYTKSAKPALEDISAEIPEGVHLLVGENGAGKSTLLYALAGLISPQKGHIDIDGVSSTSMLPSAKNEIFIFDDNLKITMPTIREFSRVYSIFYSNFSEVVFNENLSAFGLTGDEKIRKLSLGDRKKTLLAYVLALGVKVLLLDEPTNGLDIQSKDTLRRIIASSATGEQTIVISTHNVSEFKNLYDGFIAIHKGKLQLAATLDQICNVLRFSVDSHKDPDAIYSELSIGGYSSISESEGESLTDIDWELLYKALMSPACNQITALFNDNNSRYE